MRLFIENRPKFTMNVLVIALSVINGILLISTTVFEDLNYLDQVSMFFRTGIPNPSVCGPLFFIWTVVYVLYIIKKVESPSTMKAIRLYSYRLISKRIDIMILFLCTCLKKTNIINSILPLFYFLYYLV